MDKKIKPIDQGKMPGRKSNKKLNRNAKRALIGLVVFLVFVAVIGVIYGFYNNQ